MKSATRTRAVSSAAMTAILALLLLGPSAVAQSNLAPVVDAADSEAWVDAYKAQADSPSDGHEPDSSDESNGCNENGCGPNGCSAKGCAAGGCPGNCSASGGNGCNQGYPLWNGACQGGDNSCASPPFFPNGGGMGMIPMCSTPLTGGMSMFGGRPGQGLGWGTPLGRGSCSESLGGDCSCSGNCGGGCNEMLGLPCPCGACNGARSKRIDVYKDFLYLQSRNVEVAYAVPVDGPITPTLGNGVQIGRTALAQMSYEPGFRIGANFYGSNCNGLMAQWAHFESHNPDQINTTAPDVIRSLVTHPLGNNAAADGLLATADYDIDFDIVDLAFRLPYRKCNNWCAEVIWGMRYAQLNQEFQSTIDFNGTTTVTTDIDFYGLGPEVGLSAQRRFGCSCLYAYSQGLASFMVGKFNGQYQQADSFAGVVVDTSWESGRVVPVLDYELGVGVMTPGGRFRLRAGYMISAWFNAVRTDEFINAVQANNPDGLGNGLSFDGLTIRSECRF